MQFLALFLFWLGRCGRRSDGVVRDEKYGFLKRALGCMKKENVREARIYRDGLMYKADIEGVGIKTVFSMRKSFWVSSRNNRMRVYWTEEMGKFLGMDVAMVVGEEKMVRWRMMGVKVGTAVMLAFMLVVGLLVLG